MYRIINLLISLLHIPTTLPALNRGSTVTGGLYRRSLQDRRLLSMVADQLDDALHSILFRLDCRDVDRQRRKTPSPEDERWLLNRLLELSFGR